MLRFAQFEQQLQLLDEKFTVVVEIVAKEGERFDEGASPGHDLGPALGDEIEGGEALEDAHGIVGAEHGDGAAEADRLGACSGSSEDHGRSGGDEIRAVMLAEGEDVEADLISQFDGFEQILQPPGGADLPASMGVGGQFGEGIEANFKFIVCSNSELLL